MTDEGQTYWAFLSYSHRDEAAAKALQRRLETYRVPKRLVGRHTSAGRVPARVRPVFRDRDELHAGADLKAHVRDALAASRWMIVLCSPDAAGSPWVEREIVEFKKLHGEGRVLACIVAGEPYASRLAGRAHEECFPRALRYALGPDGASDGAELEPIAADMRAHADGPRRAPLKLLAGMLGLGFDELVRRDLQRRLRWLTALAVGSLAGMGVLGVLTVMATQARNDARHQREQAEGLIEFMLGDLRKKLEPVGRLEVLDSVGEKALAYYGTQDADRLDANALGHRSRALHLIGEIHDLRGNFAEAQAVFERSAATTSQLLAKNPDDPQRLFDHAQSEFWVGYAAWKRNDGLGAEQRFKRYLDLSERLSKHDPTNKDWQAEVAFAHINLGTVYVGSGRYEDALHSLQQGEATLVSLANDLPALKMELAQLHGWKAIAYVGLGRYETALAEQRNKLGVLHTLHSAPSDAQAQASIQTTLQYSGFVELAIGEVRRAEQTARQAVRLGDKLAAADPSNMAALADACFARVRMAEIEYFSGRLPETRELLAAVERCQSTLLAADEKDNRYTIELEGLSLMLKARVAAPDAVLIARMRSFVERTPAQSSTPSPGYVRRSVSIASVALALGDALAGSDGATARAAWSRAEAELEPLSSQLDGAVLTPLAQAQLRLGRTAAAQQLANRIETTHYKHPAYADLLRRLPAARGAGVIPEPLKGTSS